jgi:hypothetical protein
MKNSQKKTPKRSSARPAKQFVPPSLKRLDNLRKIVAAE